MRILVERDEETGLLVGSVPGIAGVHAQGRTFEELERHVQQALSHALEDPLMAALEMFIGAGVISSSHLAALQRQSGTFH